MSYKWKCSRCGTEDSSLRYASGKMPRCKDCQRFYNVSVNSKKGRKYGRNPSLRFNETEFLAWLRARSRICHFCGISEVDLEAQNIRSSIGLTVAALGIDRLDNDDDYTLKNIALCCYACNKAKGNVFSTEEMRIIGPAIGDVWKLRATRRHSA